MSPRQEIEWFERGISLQAGNEKSPVFWDDENFRKKYILKFKEFTRVNEGNGTSKDFFENLKIF